MKRFFLLVFALATTDVCAGKTLIKGVQGRNLLMPRLNKKRQILSIFVKTDHHVE